MNDTTSILNPALEPDVILKKVIFFGDRINNFLISLISNIPFFEQKQSMALLIIVYMVLLNVVIKLQEKILKPIIKIIIIVLIIYLIIGFFG